MMTLPAELEQFMKGQDLTGLRPFALLFRNKWNSSTNKYALESTPIDISDLIVKPNTLSMTLDVNEVAQYNANNVTLTLSDTKNYFVEGTPDSYFPDGYQLYGSRVVLYYGLDGTNRTPLFTGVIKDLPTSKPEKYQVELKLVSPLEMLKDIEAKGFSNKVTGQALTYKSTDSDGHRVYWTRGTGVGGFDAVYANGTKLFEGVDYEVDQTSALGLPAIVTIINSAYYSATITADYYMWKTGLTVEQIVAGLVGLAGYNSATEDIRAVTWNTAVRSGYEVAAVWKSLGYYHSATNTYTFSNHTQTRWHKATGSSTRRSELPDSFDFNFTLHTGTGDNIQGDGSVYLLDVGQKNGVRCRLYRVRSGPRVTPIGTRWYYTYYVHIYKIANQQETLLYEVTPPTTEHGEDATVVFLIRKRGTVTTVYVNSTLAATLTDDSTVYAIDKIATTAKFDNFWFQNEKWVFYDSQRGLTFTLTNPCIITQSLDKQTTDSVWLDVQVSRDNDNTYWMNEYFSNTNTGSWQGPVAYDLGVESANTKRYMFFVFGAKGTAGFTIRDPRVRSTSHRIVFNLVNLSDGSVLEALQDFALISGYEFGVDRQGVFFFRPRVQSTTPQYVLDHDEIVKVDTVKKNLNDFFTKLTLTFAQTPLEFYANSGSRPTLVDKYGIINKDIDKPDIVNYDNPELAQAIGPQLLETYSTLANTIQVTGKLNIALELGDIVSLRRNMNLIADPQRTDYTKFEELNTYYRACKITGLNYNFSKRQMTYTLRDVSNKNTEQQREFYEYIYDFPVSYEEKK